MYYNDQTIVYYDGQFLKAGEAKGNLFDQTLHYGYGAFEGIRAYDTPRGVAIFKAKEHFDRLEFSCRAIGIPYDFVSEDLVEVSYELLRRNHLHNAYIRPLVTCAPNMSLTKGRSAKLFIAVWEWAAYLGEKQLQLKTSSYRRITSASFIVEAKVSGHYVNSILATQEAKDLGYDEALLLDIDGYVAEGPGANFFMEKEGVLYTPPKGSILPGITRATVIELSEALGIPVVEKKLSPEEVFESESAFYCGTAAEVIGIESLDHYVFPKPWKESLGSFIQKAYKDLVLQKENQPVEKVA